VQDAGTKGDLGKYGTSEDGPGFSLTREVKKKIYMSACQYYWLHNASMQAHITLYKDGSIHFYNSWQYRRLYQAYITDYIFTCGHAFLLAI
jgi:hypothetical protein